jgi:UDP-GlcNAc3NAcA epimerase
MTTKISTILGARPQFVKASAISREIREKHPEIDEIIIHTGQHFDHNLSQVFFDELDIPKPDHNLEISGGSHGEMTGRMLSAIESVLIHERPDWVLLYGDTNSTLAGALAAAKLHIPVAHVEAGLRSFNMKMPEEINRIVADRLSSLLFCPTVAAMENLESEGIVKGAHNVGDVMLDVALHYRDMAGTAESVFERLGLKISNYVLATCHRAENTDSSAILGGILAALSSVAKDVSVVLPLHPRTRKKINEFGLESQLDALQIIEPLPFLDMVALEKSADCIVTDSGGVQKEAFFYGVPCITIRDETEWIETVELGWNNVVGTDTARIVDAYEKLGNEVRRGGSQPYGSGNAAQEIVSIISDFS